MTRDEYLDLTRSTYIPGEPMCEADLIAAMISRGHTQAQAEEVARNTRRGDHLRIKGSPYFAHSHRTHCHTVQYHLTDGMFTFIGS